MSESPFRNCTSKQVFEEVTKMLDSDDTRSLWSRVQREFRRKGVQAVGTYLDSEFTQLQQAFERDLELLASEQEQVT